jgi:hypothetical protein
MQYLRRHSHAVFPSTNSPRTPNSPQTQGVPLSLQTTQFCIPVMTEASSRTLKGFHNYEFPLTAGLQGDPGVETAVADCMPSPPASAANRGYPGATPRGAARRPTSESAVQSRWLGVAAAVAAQPSPQGHAMLEGHLEGAATSADRNP